ncbi:MAG: DUF4358 domain-containing protein [Clostridia bacterium]|nr:DUF4358 domain-containing protein [Clostridia bacterium]
MKRSIRTALSVILLLAFTACAVSCASSPSYKSDVKVEVLQKNAEQVVKLDKEELSFKDMKKLAITTAEGLSDLFDGGDVGEYVVRYTGGYSCDEYGIFRFSNEDAAKKGLEKINAYLRSKANDTTQRSYFGPEESRKYDESEAKVFGCYLTYAILTGANRTAFFDQISSLLAA